MKKRIAVLLLAMVLILSLCPTVFATAKIDVDKTTVMAGEQVIVTLTNETELTDITNLDYRVYYDKDCFEFTSSDDSEVSPMSNNNQPVAFDNSVPMHDNAGDYIAVNVVDPTSEGLNIAVGSVYTLIFTAKPNLTSQQSSDFEMVRHSVMDTTFKTGDDVDPVLRERVKVTSDVVSVTVKPPVAHENYAVTLSDDFIGNDMAVPGADYTFSAKDLQYDYTISAIMGDKNVNVVDNGDGTYTIKNVSGDLIITDTKTLKPDDENHTLTKTEAVTATCTKAGNSEYYTCSDCGKYFSDSKGTKEIAKDSWVIKAAGHTYKTTTTKATLKANGKIINKCAACGKTTTKTVYMPKTFSLSYTKATYNGKVKAPTVTVKDSKGNVLKKGTDYKVTYTSGRKAVGTYKVTIKGIGKYSFTKTLTFKIKPAATKIVSATNVATKSIKLKWNKAVGAGGYQVQLVKGSKTVKTVKITKASTLTKTLTKLTKGSTYKVRVRSYKTVSGTNYYSAWSAYKSVKVAK